MIISHITTKYYDTVFVLVKKIENRLIFGKDIDKRLRLPFWATLYS